MLRCALLTVVLGCSAVSLAEPLPQKASDRPAEQPIARLIRARAMYYTPTAQGLRGFHCGVTFEWGKLFAQLGNPLPADSPILHYLTSVRLSVSDSLHGAGSLEWADVGTPPGKFEAGAAQIKEGLQQVVTGFFTSWNGYLNGNMVPAPDEGTTVVLNNGSYTLHAASGEFDVLEDFDADFLLKQAHVSTTALDVVASPVFQQTPGGLLVSSVHNVVRQPKTAAPMEVTMSVTYAPVSGFQIPATLRVDEANVGQFDFNFSNCTVDVDTSK